MLGWELIVHTEFSESKNQSDWKWPHKDSVLATWRSNVAGLDWLKKLSDGGKVIYLGGNGYPERYLAKVKDILPLIKNGPPAHKGPLVIGDDYVTPSGWVSEITIHLEQFSKLDPETSIVIDGWDES